MSVDHTFEKENRIITHCESIYTIRYKNKTIHLFGEVHKDVRYVQPIFHCSDDTYVVPYENENGVSKETDLALPSHVDFSCYQKIQYVIPSILHDSDDTITHYQCAPKKTIGTIKPNYVSIRYKKGDIPCRRMKTIPIHEYVIQFIQTQNKYKHVFIESSLDLPGVDQLQKELTWKRERYDSFRFKSLGHVIDTLCRFENVSTATSSNKTLHEIIQSNYEHVGMTSVCDTDRYKVEFINARDAFRLYLYYLWDHNSIQHIVLSKDIIDKLEKYKYDIRFQSMLFILSIHMRKFNNVPEQGRSIKELFERMKTSFLASNQVTNDIKQDIERCNSSNRISKNTEFLLRYATQCICTSTCNTTHEDIQCVFDLLSIIDVHIEADIDIKQEIYSVYAKTISESYRSNIINQLIRILDTDTDSYEIMNNHVLTLTFASLFMDLQCYSKIINSTSDTIVVYTGAAHTESLVKIIEILHPSAIIVKESETLQNVRASKI